MAGPLSAILDGRCHTIELLIEVDAKCVLIHLLQDPGLRLSLSLSVDDGVTCFCLDMGVAGQKPWLSCRSTSQTQMIPVYRLVR